MKGLLNTLEDMQNFNDLTYNLEKNIYPILASGVIDSQKIHLASGILNKLNKNGLFITFSETKAKDIYEDLIYFQGEDNVKLYPAKDILFYNADVRSSGIIKKRFETIESLINNENISIVLSVESLFDRLVSPEKFISHIINLEVGKEIKQDTLIEKLVFMGYEASELVEGIGQFAIRGGIVDIAPSNMTNSIRIEFWGDEIDSIRILDSRSQRSIEKIETAEIFPMGELVYSQEELDFAIKKLEKEYSHALNNYEKKGLLEEKENLKQSIGEIIEKMRYLKRFNGIERFASFFSNENITLLDYLKKDTIIFIDEPTRVASQSEIVSFEFNESIKNRILKGYILPSEINMVFSYEEITSRMKDFKTVLLMTLTQSVKHFKIKERIPFSVKSLSVINDRVDLLIEDLKYYTKNKYKILILAGIRIRGERLLKELSSSGLSCELVSDLNNYKFKQSVVTIARGSLNRGFEYSDSKFILISDKELFQKEKHKSKRKQKKSGIKIESFSDLKIGDYIVHESHGIGIYKGIEQIISDEISKDYLKLGYSDGGNLYIPVSQIDVIQKYIGGEKAKIKLNKLGGGEWNRTKQRAKKAVAIIAGELITLYAQREAETGFPFSKDTVWQREFEELFSFEETDDQLKAIEDTKRDMESRKVMDRLICGDVGYGKTEVALRAAFKAVQDSKQVAYLVPTTILAQQHFNTFKQRLSDFPITVEMLSRFKTAKEQKEIIKELNKGSVDIVIGTHRILSKDIEFKNLGLIIVDEEQRFGVSQKEKLKQIKADVDVLSLSATPIPRTLHMSLNGIRDISLLEEPPLERQPIQTYVMEYSDEFVKDAINREIGRNGQVFYLYNRVRNIGEIASKLQKLVPDVNVAYAHGQMSERQLESIMLDFIQGEIDVLVCTTIIETGLDISNANTIIIRDADKMGLSQLYQLRGRVGRSSRFAYAYLMYKKDKVLTEVSEKRLRAIKEFTEFGSGFKIAMRDLEIRGAGNLLGAEQHGHMDVIGYEMYRKLLDDEVKKLKGQIVEERFETSIDIKINAYIPNFYIKNEEQKLEIYKKISYIQNNEDCFEMQEEIEDRYGDLPASVENLLQIALLKATANSIGVTSISEKDNKLVFYFRSDAKVSPIKITEFVKKSNGNILFTAGASPYMTYKLSNNTGNVNINNVRENLLQLV